MPIFTITDLFLKALAPFETIFSEPQKKNFRRLVFGLILCLEGRNIADINEKTWREKDQSSLNRFLTESPWKPAELRLARRNLLGDHLEALRPSDVYFILDDTTARKYGKEMEGVGWHYSDTDKQIILGHNMVSSTVLAFKEEKVVYQAPLDLALYRKKEDYDKAKDFKSRIALATKFIQEFELSVVTRTVLLADSWYASKTLLTVARKKGFDYIVPIKINRVIFLDGKKTKLFQLAKRKAGWLKIKVKNEIYWVKTFTVFIKGIGTVRLIISKRSRYGTYFKAFITNLADWSAFQILNAYSYRWAIETFYEDAKIHLGLDQYQIRKAEAIEKYWEIVFAAYQFLEEANLQLHWKKRMKTTGQRCLWVRKVFTQSLLDWIFQKRDMLSLSEWDKLRFQLCF